ncbi:nucleoside hydrolase [Pseudooceanicola sp. CBS1P-1]|uniref:Nucleoside hydrolase n=1 Tax=Pseudooceanicola albus TaxID=2692189 RepID=A0A6L7G7J7_9RHOB|nr:MULTISPECIES: nucleoside hydrolase [Pseudooceanicola]MBT9385937.1 nucleoside hydrolase [Pseudooceanicola endophyticus]MXN19642.1 nucleoside hydrolase [Pseudooceanicola albus]
MPKAKIILDVDTGVDDALAIYYALRHPDVDLVALTCVFGNTDVEIATANTLRILELAGHPEVPVAMGAGKSLLYPYTREADYVHGTNGLGEVALPEPAIAPVAEHAADLIIRLVKENPGEITLCPVGPMTNVGLALAKAPEIAPLIREIVVMGSTLQHPGIHGVARPMVDANIHNDPEAAHIMMCSGAPITLVGMDVTMQTLMSRDMMADITANGTPAGAKLMEIADFYVRSYEAMHPGISGCPLHDPLAVAVCHDPSLVTLETMRVDIELSGPLTRGQCIPDRRPMGLARANCKVATGVDKARFEALFHEVMRS